MGGNSQIASSGAVPICSRRAAASIMLLRDQRLSLGLVCTAWIWALVTAAEAQVSGGSSPQPSGSQPVALSPESFRTWTDSTGRYHANAAFVEFKDGMVTLKREDGTTRTVAIERLSNADQDYVRELGRARSAKAPATEAEPPSAGNDEPTTTAPSFPAPDGQEVPDTGGGLSGFLASGLWRVYRHFPSAGRWDWLFLFVMLVPAVHLLFLPLLWKAVRADMQILAQGSCDTPNQDAWTATAAMISMWWLVWFFQTAAGRTFLTGRPCFQWSPLEVSRNLFWLSLAFHVGANMVTAVVCGKIDERNKAASPPASKPYRDRTLSNLFAGGGIFVIGRDKYATQGGGQVILPGVTIFLAHLFYWYWSTASLILMAVCMLAVLVNEAIRMVFVYILHKRTFG